MLRGIIEQLARQEAEHADEETLPVGRINLMQQGTVGSHLDLRNRQAWVDLGDVHQRLALHVQKRRILRRVRDLENPLAPILGA